MNRGYAALLAALLLTAYLILTLAAVPLRARADGFTLGPGIQAAMRALDAAPASDEDFLPPDYAVSRAFDTEGRVYVYTVAEGVTVYDRDDHVVSLPSPTAAPVPYSLRAQHQAVSVAQFARALCMRESRCTYTIANYDGSGAYGAYQIMPANWPVWSRDAGLGWDAPKTAANQDTVAYFKFQQLFNAYGNWADVASVWASGRPVRQIVGVCDAWNGLCTITYVNRLMTDLGLPPVVAGQDVLR